MVDSDDSDDQHGYPKVAMVQNVRMTADGNNKKCDFAPPCVTQMMNITVTD